MAHAAADRVRETTTTTGTGTVTLAGAVSGFRAFGDVLANADTTFYTIAHRTANEWEVGLGTWATGGTLARTTVISSSNGNAAVNFSAGTKDVFVTAPAITQPYGVITPTDTTKQDNWNPTGLAFAGKIRWNGTASIGITGLQGGYEGRRILLQNGSSDYLLWLEHENSASSAANRIDLPNSFPLFLMPGDYAWLDYDGVGSRWRYVGGSQAGPMGLTAFTDFLAGAPTASLGNPGGFTQYLSGTGAVAGTSNYLTNTTERPMGLMGFATGTTALGRAGIGDGNVDAIIPTLGPALSVARLAIGGTAADGTNTYQVFTGFTDILQGTPANGVYWSYRWNGSAVVWEQERAVAGTPTRTTTGSPTPDLNYIWLPVFVNAAWTRADFLYSTDSVSFTLASSPTTGFPNSSQRTSWVGAMIYKTAGLTSRAIAVDLCGYRVDYLRG